MEAAWHPNDYANSYISRVAKTEFIAFRVAPDLKRELERIANDELRALSQICEMFLHEGVEGSKRTGPGLFNDWSLSRRLAAGLLTENSKSDDEEGG